MLSAYKKSNDPQEKLARKFAVREQRRLSVIFIFFIFQDADLDNVKPSSIIKEIMLDAQKQAYGDGLDQRTCTTIHHD